MDPPGVEALAAGVGPASGEGDAIGRGRPPGAGEAPAGRVGELHSIWIIGVADDPQLSQVVEAVMTTALCRPPDYADFRFQTLVVQGERDAAVGIIRGRQGRRGGCRELGIDPA
ncbi:MAG TPA: hypothetical protein VK988_21685, partial [Acidimicrobiales bacterium]|nr:hypothetical protein [Acidimicrobiales bacterium]